MNRQANMLLTEELVYAALKEVVDPELGINVVDLGLIYSVHVEEAHIAVEMTLTTPACPLHASFRNAIEATLRRVFPGLQSVAVELVWTPPWSPAMMTADGRAELGLS
ncbi:MAG: metal-sulfur cluster assembly factor [Candidatus Promineifilaceae bacterium]|nr:metal-sulfur cluster assembly factor [Candidatus Promineifilaceae bacterium]